ncbi:glycoside hydrolase family 38 C-terminal domain-containing protein [Cellulomonas sp. NTE-D12]|uniref:alpha-mannosidase n=1 Tax=Cellulomonas sp. NTE-D12 TaxID=2962632 RepID=UPI0030817FE3|nr:alpha-mannosidase [Cellulomonas sp. NTE-D12]
MHPTTESTLARVDRLLRDWVAPALHRARHPLTAESWTAPGEPVPFARARAEQYVPHPVGAPWGRAWSTVWFHVTGRVPADWPEPGTRLELVVDLGFDDQMPGFQAEGAVWSPDGRLLKGISPRNAWLPLQQEGGSEVDLYLEAAANPDAYRGSWTTPTAMGDLATVPGTELYRLLALDVALVDTEVEALVADLKALRGLAEVLPAESPRRAQLVEALARACDALDPQDVSGSAGRAREVLAPALAAPAAASAHRVHAVGHAHIDSAWLWPTRETARKVARTVANVLALMETDPDVTFAFSSAQHYAWLQESAPELFERMAERVREGRIVPVGGMWVESDTNLVGGEALVRQFVEGMRYFREQLGVVPTTAWLPDSFGYTAALPQIARLAGFSDLFAQKMCWNDTNPFPHHTFWWEGLDGSRLFTHFTPMDTYNARLVASQLDRASRQFADKPGSNTSLAAFGFGDGGGGPTREMVAQARRTADLDGSPHVELSTPERFFATARAEYADRAPTWVGEMYLEFHRGTYTSQARTKQGNRRSEHLLREAELWATTATVLTGAPYPHQALRRIWRLVLLQQFHDILPGSSIAWVHREAEAAYAAIAAELEQLIAAATTALAGRAGDARDAGGPTPGPGRRRVANASPYPVLGVPAGGIGVPAEPSPAALEPDATGWLLSNGSLQVRVDARGLVTSAVHLATGREVVPPGEVGNLLQTFRDIPNDFEAWNLDEHYQRVGRDLVDVVAMEVDHDGPALRIERSFGSSRVVQRLRLAAGDDPTLHVETQVDWHERHTLLKLGFTLDVQTTDAAAETQFGYVRRPTHANTSWDAAKFEVPAHRWVHVGEPDFGVAVTNDATYGHDIARVRHAGGVGTRVRLSLLRAPMYPDPDADLGRHTFRAAVTFGADLLRAGAQGWALNLPLREVGAAPAAGADQVAPLVTCDNPCVVVSAVKLADDGGPDVIVRVHEALGTRARARLQVCFPFRAATVTDLLEEPMPDHPEAAALAALAAGTGEVPLTLRPFEIRTLRFTR